MTFPSGSMATSHFAPHHGLYVFEFVVGATSDPTVTVKGPTGTQPFSNIHMGCFRVPESAQISIEAQFMSDAPFIVDVHARWFDYDSHEVLLKGPVDLLAGGFPCNDMVWNQVDLVRGGAEHSHWRPMFAFYESINDDGTRNPLAEGTSILIDCLYGPDNGEPVASQPYLDGDQPGARWEGDPHISTSVFGDGPDGTNAEPPVAQVVITPVLPEVIVL